MNQAFAEAGGSFEMSVAKSKGQRNKAQQGNLNPRFAADADARFMGKDPDFWPAEMKQLQPRRALVKGEDGLERKRNDGFKSEVHNSLLFLTVGQIGKRLGQGWELELKS